MSGTRYLFSFAQKFLVYIREGVLQHSRGTKLWQPIVVLIVELEEWLFFLTAFPVGNLCALCNIIPEYLIEMKWNTWNLCGVRILGCHTFCMYGNTARGSFCRSYLSHITPEMIFYVNYSYNTGRCLYYSLFDMRLLWVLRSLWVFLEVVPELNIFFSELEIFR